MKCNLSSSKQLPFLLWPAQPHRAAQHVLFFFIHLLEMQQTRRLIWELSETETDTDWGLKLIVYARYGQKWLFHGRHPTHSYPLGKATPISQVLFKARSASVKGTCSSSKKPFTGLRLRQLTAPCFTYNSSENNSFISFVIILIGQAKLVHSLLCHIIMYKQSYWPHLLV